jgi:two-component system chemotaxis sensor kinase CheA
VLGEAILPLAGCGEGPPDRKIRILRLTDGLNEIAYGFGEVIDIVSLASELQPSASPGEVSGVTLIGGEQVELVDSYWLFETHGEAAPSAAKPVCAIPPGDPWMDNILRPIVESAGYDVTVDPTAADVVIARAEDEVAASEVIRIRSSLDLAHENDDSIYRYDRAGLMSALSRRAAKGRS